MRLWTLHPKYLDARGLVALWREGLLAQAVLRGKTKGYVNHPQLVRFQAQPSPVGSIAFAVGKIGRARGAGLITVTRDQLDYEWEHLMAKLAVRDSRWRDRLERVKRPEPHPLFRVIAGGCGALGASVERCLGGRFSPYK